MDDKLHNKAAEFPKVDGPPRIMSIVSTTLSWIPRFMRRSLMVYLNKPTQRLVDVYDALQEDPYTIEEVETDRIWRVAYEVEDQLIMGGQLKGFIDINTEKGRDGIIEEAEKIGLASTAYEDIEHYKSTKSIRSSKDKSESLKAGTISMNMFVVKLLSGDVLLYSPVHVHNHSSLSKYLEGLGPVKWIVIGSSYHTLCLPSVLGTFPDAAVVGATDAETKLNAVSALRRGKLDFDLTKPADEVALRSSLDREGVSAHYIRGDIMTQAIWLRAHNTLLEVDNLYGHHKNCSCLMHDNNSPLFTNPMYWNRRLLLWAFSSRGVTDPDYGLGLYRFWMMDPARMAHLALSPLPPNQSATTVMADSLRRALGSEFTQAACVHYPFLLSADDFRKSINYNWRWLDGKSLI